MGATRYRMEVDIWSYGCVLGEVLLGAPLFTGDSSAQQVENLIILIILYIPYHINLGELLRFIIIAAVIMNFPPHPSVGRDCRCDRGAFAFGHC